MRELLLGLSVSLLLISSAACSEKKIERSYPLRVQFENADGSKSPELRAEVVADDPSRAYGLMYRREMAETDSMFFVFPDEKPRSFWMKNTYIPLDIIYIDTTFKVVSIARNAAPLTTSPRPSKGPARYVLEVGGGLAKKWGVKKGSAAKVTGDIPEAR